MASKKQSTEQTTSTLETITPLTASQKNQGKIAELTEKYEAMYRELETKEYSLSLDYSTASDLISYIAKDAQWEYTESLGVVKLHDILNNQIEGLSPTTDQVTFKVYNIDAEALFYFIGKKKGTGLAEARSFSKILEPVNSLVRLIREDSSKLQLLVKEIESLQQGIPLEGMELAITE